jgi:F0F1-type ATP synthase assembly protein I
MTNRDEEQPLKEGASDEGPGDWVVVGIYGALGFEFVAAVLSGAWIGTFLDRRFGTGPYGLVGCIFVMLMGVGWHIVRISRRLLQRR